MIFTFSKGGIHPAENKLSSKKEITTAPIPKQVAIPLAQHIGAPAKAIVKKGDEVKVGLQIGESAGFISANVHSSVSGKVFKVDNLPDIAGNKIPHVVINVEGDEWLEEIDQTDALTTDIKLSKEEIIERTQKMGIVGLGGATFPTNVKINPPKDYKAEVILVNGVECEPYLTADERLMLEKPEQVFIGVEILKKALGVEKAIIGIENNKPEAIKTMKAFEQKYNTQVYPLKVKYPQGAEKQLIKACIGKEVPSGKLPIAVGAVVQNVGTVFAIYEAIQKNKPLFERVVTVTGKKLNEPGNFLTRIGTPVKDLIELCGGVPENTGKIINGGPMMGKAISTTNVPVMKGSSGVLIMDETEASRPEQKNCIRCAKCVSVCPMGLEPYLLMNLSQKKMNEEMKENSLMDCIECGSCSYVCPADRALLDYIRLGKANLRRS
jgi:electron transport complex protein RnfC